MVVIEPNILWKYSIDIYLGSFEYGEINYEFSISDESIKMDYLH